MKITTTVLISLLFLLVWFAFNRLDVPKTETVNTESSNEELHEPDLMPLTEEDTVTWLQIQNLEKKQVMTLVRTDENWGLKFPVQYAANSQMVNSFLLELMNTKKEKQFTPEKDWEEYGLLRPEIKIGIETENFPERRYLYLGDRSPVDTKIFARWEGEKGYFLLDPQIKEIFEKSVYSLREKRLLRQDDPVQKVLVRIYEETYQWNRENDKWVWQYPEHLRGIEAPEGVLKEVLLFLKDLHIKEFLDDAVNSRSYGFSEYSNFIKVDYKGASEAIFVGEELPQRDAFYAKRRDENTILLVSREHLKHFFEAVQMLTAEADQRASTALT